MIVAQVYYYSLVAIPITYLLVCLFTFIKRRLSVWSVQGIPSQATLFLEAMRRPLHEVDRDCFRKYGKVFGTFEFLTPVLMVADPDVIKQVLVKQFSDFAERRRYILDGQIFSEFLFVSPHEKWKNQRSILNSAFSWHKIKNLKPIFDQSISQLVDELSSVAQSGDEINLMNVYQKTTLDIITRAVLGVEIEQVDDNNDKIMGNIHKLMDLKLSLKRLVFVMSKQIAKLFDIYMFDYNALKFLLEVIEKIVDIKKLSGNNKATDLIRLMLDAEDTEDNQQAKKKLTKKEIIDNALMLILSSFDVTLAKMSFLLATHLDIQDKLFNEIDSITESDPSIDTINQLKYLDAFVNETLRFDSTFKRIERRVLKNTVLRNTPYGDILLPKDTIIVLSTHVHNDPDYWLSPEQFQPERFLPENKHLIDQSAYLPFGMGPRTCLGMSFALIQLKMCIFNVVRRFRFKVTKQTKNPMEFEKNLTPFGIPKAVVLKVVARCKLVDEN